MFTLFDMSNYSIILRKKNQLDRYLSAPVSNIDENFDDVFTVNADKRYEFSSLGAVNLIVQLMLYAHFEKMSKDIASELTDKTLYIGVIDPVLETIKVAYFITCPSNRLLEGRPIG